MKILIVHDRPDVASVIADTAKSVAGSSLSVDIAEDGSTARAMLQAHIYDLLIVDLTLPFIKGQTSPDYRTADDLLRELFTLESLNIPGDIIGVTRDEEALAMVRTSIGPHLMVTISESEDDTWKKYLEDKIAYALRAAKARPVAINQHHYYDALILTALDKEQEVYRNLYPGDEVRHYPGAYEFLFADRDGNPRRGIRFSIGKSGQASTASRAQSLVSFFRPKLAVMSGFCGGVTGKAKLGDLIFFETVYDWDYGKWSEEKDPDDPASERLRSVFLSRPNPLSIGGTELHRIAREFVGSDFNQQPSVLTKVRQLSEGKLTGFGMGLTATASGSAVVANDEIIAQIRGLNDAIRAVDMEAYGFYQACAATHVVTPAYICVKAVADFCNGEKGDELHLVCSELSASVVVEFLTKRFGFA